MSKLGFRKFLLTLYNLYLKVMQKMFAPVIYKTVKLIQSRTDQIEDGITEIIHKIDTLYLNQNEQIVVQEFEQLFEKDKQNSSYMKCVFEMTPNESVDIYHLNIAFLIPDPIKGGGGHRNLFRAVKFLKDFGHTLTVYYTHSILPADDCKQNVSDWFYDMGDIPFINYEGEIGYHDVVIASWWQTAYFLKNNINKVKYPFYFVQDFEPSFFPMGSSYILCENTYKMGFTHICSGPWCKAFLENKYDAEADYFQLPIDFEVYNTNKPRTKQNKNVVFFAKPEMPRRCYEIGVQALAEFSLLRPDVEIIFFGSDKVDVAALPFKTTLRNLLPTLDDLADLYRNADVGIAFSSTNPSLIPYEMICCGCPVVDLNFGGALSKYGNDENNVFLFDTLPGIFAKQLSDIIDDKEALKKKVVSAQNWVKQDFPSEKEMAQQVENMIVSKIVSGKINAREIV